ncbi:hypothetical protein ACHAWT_001178 [Skeletonema menzelii]
MKLLSQNVMPNNLKDPRFLVIATGHTIIYNLWIIYMYISIFGWAIMLPLCTLGLEGDLVLESSSENINMEGTYTIDSSERSKKRIDQVRQCVVERLLLNYNLTLGKEHDVDRQQLK